MSAPNTPVSLSRLIDHFERLPGIGRKTAQRLAFYVLDLPKSDAEDFAGVILEAHEKIKYFAVCQNLTDLDLCPICTSPSRDQSTICVVENSQDLIALERTHEFDASYHVLHGLISPLNDIGPEQLKIHELLDRIHKGDVKEVIMATNPTLEGDATAMYISKLIKPLGVKVTRLAYGIPVGGNLEYADEVTLLRALEGRNEI